MSQILTTFIAKERVPNKTTLQEAVQSFGFKCEIDEFYQPFECSGFLPITLNGQHAGFEIDFASAEELLARLPDLRPQVGGRDSTVSFRWSSDSAECACALIVAAALARVVDAVVYYRDGGVFYTAERLIDDGKKLLSESR
jgi:hypothetical protein